MIKPDAVHRRLTGPIVATLEEAGFTIVAMKKVQLTKVDAETFYQVHRERPFFKDLVEYISSGPVVAMVLAKDGGTVEALRALMGATDPAQAAPDTIRARWGESIERNVIHGSDGPETARTEIAFFFSDPELAGRLR